jgi:hypothetical protein
MIGPEGVVELVRAYLESVVPGKIIELQTRLGVTSADLPQPNLYSASQYERLELPQFPAIEVQFLSMANPILLDQEAQALWRVPYRVRVYATSRGTSFQQVEERRKRLYLALFECLTAHVLLSPSSSDLTAWVDVKTMQGQFFGLGNIVPDGEGRSIAATYIDLTAIVEEMTEPLLSADGTSLGTADTVFSSVHPIEVD